MSDRNYVSHDVVCDEDSDGVMKMRSRLALGDVARNTGEWLHHWAATTPNSVFLMERSGPGWREISYAEALEQVRALAATLLARGMGPETPIVVLSGPGIDHAVLMLAAQYVGVPLAPLAEQYSLIPQAHTRLDYCIRKVGPTMVYASDGEKYQRALNHESVGTAQRVVSTNAAANAIPFTELLSGKPDQRLEDAHASVGPDTLAKVLFTSGSTGNPKGVPQTQQMLTVNQAQYQACLPMLSDRPPVFVDWLPWNHVFAGNSNFNMILANGGTLILDDGKPVKGLFDRTLENLSMHVGTMSWNVPAGYALLVNALRQDKKLRQRFFADLDLIFYAGASLSADLWSALEQMATEVTGTIPMMTSSWGLTETAPACLIHHQGGAQSGMIGVPVPELEAKLVPYQQDRFEIRVKGPNVITSYYNEPEISKESFDEEGFFMTKDAVQFVDPTDLSAGVRFDGRITEDFKLSTGTWVQAAEIRLKALAVLEGLVQDVVVTGADRDDVGLLIFPSQAESVPPPNDGDDDSNLDVLTDPAYCQRITEPLQQLASESTGTSNRIARVLLMSQPPSIERGEITAKGSLNINAVLTARAHLLARLYDNNDPACLRI